MASGGRKNYGNYPYGNEYENEERESTIFRERENTYSYRDDEEKNTKSRFSQERGNKYSYRDDEEKDTRSRLSQGNESNVQTKRLLFEEEKSKTHAQEHLERGINDSRRWLPQGDKSNAYTQEFKGEMRDSCSTFSQEIKRHPSVALAEISTRSTGGNTSKNSSQEDDVEAVRKPSKGLSEEMNHQKAVAVAGRRAVELEYNTGLTRKIPIEEDNDLFYGERSENDVRIVLVGRTGCGKSATGNTILQTKVFKSKAAGSSVTEKCERGTNQVLGKRLVVIDTPGLFDTKLAKGEVTREIIRCIQMSAPGPHVFILVLRSDRFTQEEKDTFLDLFDIFGEQMSKFAIIAFTHLDDIEHDQSSIEEFISSSDDALKGLIRKVKNRYMAFNNRVPDDQKYHQSEACIKYVDKIVAANGGRCYTNELYKEAEENLRRKIEEVERIKAEEKQREIKEIEKKFIGQIQSVEKINEMQNEMIKKQAKEKIKIEHAQKQKEAEIERLEKDMKKLNQEHEKELLEVKREEKRRAERELDVLRNRNSEISELRQIIEKQSEDTDRKLKCLMSEKQNEIQKIQSEFQSDMKQTVQSIVAANETVVTSLKRENKRLQEDKARLSKLVSRNDARIDSFQNQIANLEMTISSLQNTNSDSDSGSNCQIL